MPATDFKVNDATLSAFRLLLFRWERDVAALCDYRTKAEQDDLLWRIEHAIARSFQHDRCWDSASAAYWARSYRKALEARLIEPKFFMKPGAR